MQLQGLYFCFPWLSQSPRWPKIYSLGPISSFRGGQWHPYGGLEVMGHRGRCYTLADLQHSGASVTSLPCRAE